MPSTPLSSPPPFASGSVAGLMSVADKVKLDGLSRLTVLDEAATLTTNALALAFVGSGVTASEASGVVTVTVPGGGISGSGSSGALAFWTGASTLSEDPTQLFWDNTNNLLGLGTATPSAHIDVKKSEAGSIIISARNLLSTGRALVRAVNDDSTTLMEMMATGTADAGTLGAGIAALWGQGSEMRIINNTSGDLTFWSNPFTKISTLTAAGLLEIAGFNTINTYKGATAITAHAGGGQASAVALTSEVNFIGTVSTAGDSVKLPVAALGKRCVVFNNGASNLDVFPVSGSTIDSLALNAAYTIGPGRSRTFWGRSTVLWESESANLASTTYDGLLASTDKSKLDSFTVVPAGATAAQIQALIDGLGVNGGTVFFGSGTWALGTTTLNINGNIRLVGLGQGSTILTYTGTSGTAIQVNSGGGLETLRAGVSNLTLDGLSLGKYGIILGQTGASPLSGGGYFENVTVKRFTATNGGGVKLKFTALATWMRCTFESNRDGLVSVFDGDNANGATTQYFLTCRFVTNDQRGAWVDQADSWNFWGCQFENNGWEGCRIEKNNDTTSPMRNVQFESCYFEDNSQAAAGTYPDLNFSNAFTYSNQDMAVRRTRFQGSNAAGNIKFGYGSFIEEDNVFVPVSVNNVICVNSGACFVTCRTNRDPATFYTVGAVTPVLVWRQGGATFEFLVNSGGTFVAATTTATNSLTTNAGIAFTLTSDVPDSSSAIAVTFNNTTALPTTGAKLVSWKVAGVEKASMTAAGSFVGSSYYASGTGAFSTLSSNAPVNFTGNRTAASTNPAVRINNLTALTDTNGTLLEISNHATFTTYALRVRKAGDLNFDKADISASPGAGTVSKAAGWFAFAAGTGTGGILITNTVCLSTSAVLCFIQTNDATAKHSYAVPGSGSFTAYLDVNCTGIVKVYFEVRN